MILRARVVNRVSAPEVPCTPMLIVEAVQLVPTAKFRADVRLDPALKETLEGVSVAATHEGTPVATKETVPAKPFKLLTVTVGVPDRPSAIWSDAGDIETEKSCIARLRVTECCRDPVWPVIVTM